MPLSPLITIPLPALFLYETNRHANRQPGSGPAFSPGRASPVRPAAVQNTPPGAAALSLHARLERLTPEDVTRALEIDKALIQVWSLRGSPHIFPTADFSVFTQGLLPPDEDSRQEFIYGIKQALPLVQMSVTEIAALTAQAANHVLDQRILDNKQELDRALAGWIAPRLDAERAAAWGGPSLYAADQTLGEALVSFTLRLVALRGLICFAPRKRNEASFVRTVQWLVADPPHMDVDEARAELARRYLRCYGPSTSRHFAAWAGISTAQAKQTWGLLAAELVQVRVEGSSGWLLQEDLMRLEAPPPAYGVRFLPAHDPFLQLRDRASLVAEKALQRRIWRTVGSPGVILAGGEVIATWRASKKGGCLRITLEPLASITPELRQQVRAEAMAVAPFRGCAEAEPED